jgi:hypothetical protein
MTPKQIIGAATLVSFFAAWFIGMARDMGAREAGKMFAFSIGVTIVLVLAVCLLTGDL